MSTLSMAPRGSAACRRRLLLVLATALQLARAQAADVATPAWQPLSDAVLAQACGGTERGNALMVSFSIERLLTVNGDPVASGRLAVTSLSAAGGTTAPLAAIGAAASSTLPALLLQNDMNGQLIRAQTTVNTTVNSLATLKALNFGDSLRQALATAAAPR